MAISAAFTVATANPNHDYMLKNLEFYRTMQKAKESYFVDLEAKQYQVALVVVFCVNKSRLVLVLVDMVLFKQGLPYFAATYLLRNQLPYQLAGTSS